MLKNRAETKAYFLRGVVFEKGVRVAIGVPGGRGLGSGLGGWWGGGFPLEMREKGKGVGRVGGAVGTGKGTGKSMRKLCRNYPLAIYPLVSLPKKSWIRI